MVLVSGVAWHTGQPPTCHHSTPDNQRPEVGAGQLLSWPARAALCTPVCASHSGLKTPLSPSHYHSLRTKMKMPSLTQRRDPLMSLTEGPSLTGRISNHPWRYRILEYCSQSSWSWGRQLTQVLRRLEQGRARRGNCVLEVSVGH